MCGLPACYLRTKGHQHIVGWFTCALGAVVSSPGQSKMRWLRENSFPVASAISGRNSTNEFEWEIKGAGMLMEILWAATSLRGKKGKMKMNGFFIDSAPSSYVNSIYAFSLEEFQPKMIFLKVLKMNRNSWNFCGN